MVGLARPCDKYVIVLDLFVSRDKIGGHFARKVLENILFTWFLQLSSYIFLIACSDLIKTFKFWVI